MLNQEGIVTDPEKQARIFKVLSVSTRVRMIELLKSRPLCVNALAHALDAGRLLGTDE